MNNSFLIQRDFTFCAAHRIEGHPKCGRLHGHNYKVQITLEDDAVDDRGMVLDFGKLDEIMKPKIDAMDHRYLVSQANTRARDPYAEVARSQGHAFMLGIQHSTAELLAQLIHLWAYTELNIPPEWVTVSVEETPRNRAVFTGHASNIR